MSETIYEAPLDVAMQLAHNVAPPTKIVTQPIAKSTGFVLAEEVIARSDLPPFDASRVDGYAVSGTGPWKLIGTNLAGSTSDLVLGDNQAIYVATGAALPEATESVLKQEECQTEGDLIQLALPNKFEAGQNIRPTGLEAKLNESVLSVGTKLTPALLGLASACGYEVLKVYQKPKVDVLIFGDELTHQGNSENGKVRDSIGPQMQGWLVEFGAELNQVIHVADRLSEHVSAIKKSNADLIITTGGTASGPVDHLHQAIAECAGTILIDAVLVRPGYHQLIAQLPDKFLIGLPGNPQSAVVGLLALVSNFVTGSTAQSQRKLEKRVLARDVSAPANEHRMVLARELTVSEAPGLVEPVSHLDSSMLRGFIDADGYLIIEPGGNSANSLVSWISLPN